MFTRLRCPTNPFRPGIRGVRSSFPASLTARGPQRRRPNDWSSWSAGGVESTKSFSEVHKPNSKPNLILFTSGSTCSRELVIPFTLNKSPRRSSQGITNHQTSPNHAPARVLQISEASKLFFVNAGCCKRM